MPKTRPPTDYPPRIATTERRVEFFCGAYDAAIAVIGLAAYLVWQWLL